MLLMYASVRRGTSRRAASSQEGAQASVRVVEFRVVLQKDISGDRFRRPSVELERDECQLSITFHLQHDRSPRLELPQCRHESVNAAYGRPVDRMNDIPRRD